MWLLDDLNKHNYHSFKAYLLASAAEAQKYVICFIGIAKSAADLLCWQYVTCFTVNAKAGANLLYMTARQHSATASCMNSIHTRT